MTVKITGLDKLTKQFDDAQKALAALDGELGTVRFDPHDPASVEAAIQEIETMIDTRVGAYASNPIIGQLVGGLKERYRQGILDRAAEARMGGADDES